MSALTDLQAQIDAINTETNAIADEITALKNQIAGGLSADDAANVTAQLTAISSKLQGIAAPTA